MDRAPELEPTHQSAATSRSASLAEAAWRQRLGVAFTTKGEMARTARLIENGTRYLSRSQDALRSLFRRRRQDHGQQVRHVQVVRGSESSDLQPKRGAEFAECLIEGPVVKARYAV